MAIKVYSHDIEQAILGGILLAGDKALVKVKEIIEPEDFYVYEHREIYKAILEVGNDILSISGFLEKHDRIRFVPMEMISLIVENVATSAGIKQHAQSLRDMSVRRKVSDLGKEIQAWISQTNKETPDILALIKKRVRLLDARKDRVLESNLTVAQNVYAEIQRKMTTKNHTVGCLTGIETIDGMLHGLEPKTLILIAARPSIGKTALALNIIEHVTRNYDGKCTFFSLDMSSEAVMMRRLACAGLVELANLKKADLNDSEMDKLNRALNIVSESNAVVIDKPFFKSLENVESFIASYTMSNKVSAIFIDYVQLMHVKAKTGNRNLELGVISSALKSMAKEYNVPVIALAQLSRNKDNTKPKLSSLRDSGSLEADADVCFMLHTESRGSMELEIACLKARDGELWHSTLAFEGRYQKVYDQDPIIYGG